jgi:DNA-binding CsgD family transcriptional regulator
MEIKCPICRGNGIVAAIDIPGLSDKSYKIFCLVDAGLSMRKVANLLKISSPSTVLYHYRRANKIIKAGSKSPNNARREIAALIRAFNRYPKDRVFTRNSIVKLLRQLSSVV